MKKLIGGLALVVCAAMGGYLSSFAAGQNGQTVEPRIGLVDLTQVFKNYAKYQQQQERLKQEIQQEQAALTEMEDRIVQLEKERKSFNPDSREYQKLDDEITQQKVALAAQAKQADKRLAQRESALFHSLYTEVLEVVARVAKYKHLSLVLRFNSDDVSSPANPREVYQSISRQVLYHEPAMDMTEIVLKELNRSYQQSAGSAQPSTPSNRTARQEAPPQKQSRKK